MSVPCDGMFYYFQDGIRFGLRMVEIFKCASYLCVSGDLQRMCYLLLDLENVAAVTKCSFFAHLTMFSKPYYIFEFFISVTSFDRIVAIDDYI